MTRDQKEAQQMLTVIDKEGNAYPVGGCRIASVPLSEGYNEYELLLISPLGSKEYTIAKTGSAWGDWPIPGTMTALRDKIVQALRDKTTLLDFTQKEQPESETK